MAIYTNEGLTDLLNDEYEKVRLLEKELETTKKQLEEAIEVINWCTEVEDHKYRANQFLAKLKHSQSSEDGRENQE